MPPSVREFQAAVALLAVGHITAACWVEVAAGLFDLECAERGEEIAEVVLAAHLELLGDFRREHFSRIHGAFGRRATLAQAVDVVAIQRQPLRRPHRQRERRRDGGLGVVLRRAAGGGVKVGGFDPLLPDARDDLDAVFGE
ncbi:hypothetical protein G6F31_017521 [Rhizopus arrhizus]|nr:hypothetical protein G6F31_017521 [Rhizopus arrhizus]